MKRRARERAVRLFDHDNVDGSGQGSRIDFIVNVPEIADELAQVIHAGAGGAGNRSDAAV